MSRSLIAQSLILCLLMVPFQHAFAEESDLSIFEKIKNEFEEIIEDPVGKTKEYGDKAIEEAEKIRYLQQYFENFEFEPDKIKEYEELLSQLLAFNSSYFVFILTQNSNLAQNLLVYDNDKLNEILNEIETNHEVSQYRYDRTQDIKEVSDRILLTTYSDLNHVDEIREIDQHQGIVIEIIILAAKGVVWPDGKGGYMTFEEVAINEIEKNPHLKNIEGIDKDPVRVFVIIALNSDYLYTQPIMPVGDKMITLEEYCIAEIDEESCYKLKTALAIAKLASKGNSPFLYQKSAIQVFYLIKEIDEKNGSNFHNETSFVEQIFAITEDDLFNVEFIKISNNKYVSLNEASVYGYDEKQIELAKQAAKIIINKEKSPSEILDALNLFVSIIEDIEKQYSIQ